MVECLFRCFAKTVKIIGKRKIKCQMSLKWAFNTERSKVKPSEAELCKAILPASHVVPRSLHMTKLLFLLLSNSPKLAPQLAGNGLHLQPYFRELGKWRTRFEGNQSFKKSKEIFPRSHMLVPRSHFCGPNLKEIQQESPPDHAYTVTCFARGFFQSLLGTPNLLWSTVFLAENWNHWPWQTRRDAFNQRFSRVQRKGADF